MSKKNIGMSLLNPPVEKGGFNEFIKESLKDWITYSNLKERIFNEYAITYPRRSWNKYIELKTRLFVMAKPICISPIVTRGTK